MLAKSPFWRPPTAIPTNWIHSETDSAASAAGALKGSAEEPPGSGSHRRSRPLPLAWSVAVNVVNVAPALELGPFCHRGEPTPCSVPGPADLGENLLLLLKWMDGVFFHSVAAKRRFRVRICQSRVVVSVELSVL
ncbi:hypothetical protein INR49_017057 [Caranx melampygus]|nr:hypothetical protein INR49_017057 [Caranx melampygus]